MGNCLADSRVDSGAEFYIFDKKFKKARGATDNHDRFCAHDPHPDVRVEIDRQRRNKMADGLPDTSDQTKSITVVQW